MVFLPDMAEQAGDSERTPTEATCIPVVNQEYITATTLRAMCSAGFGRSPGPESPSPTVLLFCPSWRSGCCSAAGSEDMADSDDEDSKNIAVVQMHNSQTSDCTGRRPYRIMTPAVCHSSRFDQIGIPGRRRLSVRLPNWRT